MNGKSCRCKFIYSIPLHDHRLRDRGRKFGHTEEQMGKIENFCMFTGRRFALCNGLHSLYE